MATPNQPVDPGVLALPVAPISPPEPDLAVPAVEEHKVSLLAYFKQFFGWGESYDRDTNCPWSRRFDTLAFWTGWVTRWLFSSRVANIVFAIGFVVVQVYLNADKFAGAKNVKFLDGHFALQRLAPLASNVSVSLLLLVPWIASKRKESQQKESQHELVEDHIFSVLDGAMTTLALDLKDPDPEFDGPACKGDVRANIAIVRKSWFNRYLVHLATSAPTKRPDREVAFLLDEGLAGWAYSRPGMILSESYDDAVKKLRPSTKGSLNKSNRVIACRAIGLDLRKVQPPKFNKVLGVIIVTSDDDSDLDRFRDPVFQEMVHKSASGLGKLLADVRRTYDGY